MNPIDRIYNLITTEIRSNHSISDISKKSGLARKTIHNYLSNNTANIDTVKRLLDALQIDEKSINQ